VANLPLLPPAPIVDASGAPNAQMLQYWQQFSNQIAANIEAVANAQTSANGAGATAQDALNVANANLDQATADGLYVHQDATPPWVDPTGTLSRATFSTYTAPTISNPPTQAEVQDIANAAQSMSQHLAALIADLRSNNALT
jgi:hypothetical protein